VPGASYSICASEQSRPAEAFPACIAARSNARRQARHLADHFSPAASPSIILCVRVQDGDTTTKEALLDYQFHLATGNLDEAFRAVKVAWDASSVLPL
jgi:hypothetical protein